ncbi:ectonucleoside triphosphate diphosphohydrolase 3-like [Sinocyclocheilus grahami]|uniref:ectonucleoside triphosphate diphosphohydrolase 3-like n=1 Tax=Sinocyclocheilus grahami TaxID=75366 RepID=UPI0007ACCEB5|nr:PREDICTED: ectonucleoside triphosphate diphosphohydrolase 3-like [Sinocyclocheilus grahami]
MINKESQSSDHLTTASRRGVRMAKVAIALAAAFMLASIAVIISIAVVQNHKKTYISRGLKYGIVLDAGSSRTTVYLYEWPAEKENNTGVVSETTKCEVEGPGISDLGKNGDQDEKTLKSLKDCIEKITEVIPSHRHNSTPVFLGATAGMRLLHWASLKHPCYPSGYNISMLAEEVFGSECTKNDLPTKYSPKRYITFFGQSNPEHCKFLLRSIFDLTSCQGTENCSFDGVYQPPLSGDFMAYAGFYWTAWALKVEGSKSMETFNTNMKLLCSKDWKTLKTSIKDIKDIHLKSYCYSANYVHSILADGYKFNTDNWKNLNFQKEVNKTSIAWSLGYMLALSNMIPAEGKIIKLPINNVLFTGLLLLFSALTIITLTYLVIALVRFCY